MALERAAPGALGVADVLPVLEMLPDVARYLGALEAVTRLNGLTNLVLRLACDNGCFVLRLPVHETARGLDRAGEYHNLRVAVGLSIAVAPLSFDVANGVMLSPALEVLDQSVDPRALGQAVGRLHGVAGDYRGALVEQDLLQPLEHPEIDEKFRSVSNRGADAWTVFETLRQRYFAEVEQDVFKRHKVPSHCDLSPGNILMTPDGLHLIDFEYSAFAPAAWDLAYAILENGFGSEQEAAFLAAHEAEAGFEVAAADLQAMKACCDLVSARWALSQVVQGNEAGDFLHFARTRLARAGERLG